PHPIPIPHTLLRRPIMERRQRHRLHRQLVWRTNSHATYIQLLPRHHIALQPRLLHRFPHQVHSKRATLRERSRAQPHRSRRRKRIPPRNPHRSRRRTAQLHLPPSQRHHSPPHRHIPVRRVLARRSIHCFVAHAR